MKRITWQEAEKILGGRLDRRKAYYFNDDPEMKEFHGGGGPVFDYSEWTTECSGCTETYMGQYVTGIHGQGVGCEECGYTGKRRDGWHSPVSLPSNRPIGNPCDD